MDQRKIGHVMKIAFIIILGLVLLEGAALLVLKSQITRYDTYWRNQSLEPVMQGDLKYVALGDSTAQAIGATSPGRGYVGLLADSLQKKYQRPVHITNLSVSGARLQDCIDEQLPQLKNLDPDVVTIEIGANDMKDFTPEVFTQKFNEILQELPKKTIVSNMPYFGGGRYSGLENNVESANRIVDQLIQQHGFKKADVHAQTKDNNHLNTYAVDFFHPSNAGYKNWHNAFWEVMGDE